MSRFILSRQKLFGLLELDAAGTVLYSRIEAEGGPDGSPSDVRGHNFYSEVVPFLNVEEFHHRIDTLLSLAFSSATAIPLSAFVM